MNPIKKKIAETTADKIKIWLPLLLAISLIVGVLIGMKTQGVPLFQTNTYQSNNRTHTINVSEGSKIEEILRYLENRYVEEVDREKLTETAVESILDRLDPHSLYYSAQELVDVNEKLEGNFTGVGIEFMMIDDTILVVSAIHDGPADKVGILPGDKIISVEDSIIAGVNISTTDIIDQLRGEEGSIVNLGVKRGTQLPLLKFKIERGEIPLKSVDVAYMLNDKTGYIKVNRFSATTHTEFMDSLSHLVEKEGLQNLVLDLRENPGGYLQEATKMLSQFFKDNKKLLVYTEGRAVKRKDYETMGRPFFDINKIAILIDEGSASASEIMAGAIQDWDRGVVIGRRSFGKGLVQEQYNLRDGSALRLVIARYYTPTGRSIQKPYGNGVNYDNDLSNRLSKGELYDDDIYIQSDTTKFYTLKEKRVVYGGGGITPDLFIPVDSLTLDHRFLRLREHVPQFVFRQMELGNLNFSDKALEDFVQNYSVSDATLDKLYDYAHSKGTSLNRSEMKNFHALLKQSIKARIAKKFYGEKGFFAVYNYEDPAVNAALNAFKSKNPVAALKE